MLRSAVMLLWRGKDSLFCSIGMLLGPALLLLLYWKARSLAIFVVSEATIQESGANGSLGLDTAITLRGIHHLNCLNNKCWPRTYFALIC